MDEKTVLGELGLSDGEIKVYLALLKLGPSSVSILTKETAQHRTTIYDFLDHLLEKGLVSFSVQSGVKYFKVAPPENLHEFLKEKEQHLLTVLPNLKKLAEFKKEEFSVDVYKGREGYKNFMSYHLRELKNGGDFYGFGVDESKFNELFPTEMKRMFKEEERLGIREWNLAEEGTKFVFKEKTVNYRYIPSEYFNPTPFAVFGNVVSILIWEPLHVIMIRSRQLADAYRKYHKLLWSIAHQHDRLHTSEEDEIKVELHKGAREYSTMLKEILTTLKNGEEVLIFGIDDDNIMKTHPDYAADLKEYFKTIIKKRITERVIIKMGNRILPEAKTTTYRFLPQETIGNTAFQVYGNKVAIFLWGKPNHLIIIEGKEVAQSYKKQFELMWEIAKGK